MKPLNHRPVVHLKQEIFYDPFSDRARQQPPVQVVNLTTEYFIDVAPMLHLITPSPISQPLRGL